MIKTLNHIIEFIEVHLCEDITLEMIANEAGVSDYHFRKIFFFLTGATLSEYIRMRRLSEAGKDLLSGMKVTDVAFKYGYESIDGFTRSFKLWSTTLPSDVYKTKTCTLYPKVSFSISVSGGINMQYRIVEKPAFHLAGVTKRVPMQFEGVNQEIVKLAQSITERQREELHRIQNVEPKKVVNASYEADTHFMKEEGELTHLIGVLTTETRAGQQLETVAVPALTWAVFPCEGPFPGTLQQTMADIYAQWLPSSKYELVDAPNFSWTTMDEERSGYATSEVWIAVKPLN